MNKEPQVINVSSEDDQIMTNKNIKAWKNLQKLRYLLFLITYQQDLERGFEVQKIVWYSKLSQFVENVQPYQCGDYHQIKLSQHGSIQGIIDYFMPRILMQKQQIIQEIQRAQQIVRKDPNFGKNNNEISSYDENKIQIIKYQRLIPDINSQFEPASQSNQSLIEEEISNQNLKQKKQLFVEDIVVIQRDVLFRYSNFKEQERRIEKIISIFKNYQSQVKDVEKFKNYCINIMINESIKQKKQQNFKENINQVKNLQFFFSDEEDKSNQQQSEESEEEQSIQSNNQQYVMKYKKEILWRKSQITKLITFLNIVKEKYETNKSLLHKKCSEYLSSDKSHYDCERQISYMCKKYSGRFQDMLQKETIKLQISKQTIENEREKYLMKEKNPLGCEIKVQFQPIKLIKQKSKSPTFEIKVPSVKFEFQPLKIQPQNQKPQKKNQKEEQTVDKQRMKYFLHLKVSNQIFTIINNSAKDQIKFKQQNNFIILIKNSKIKLTIQQVEKKNEDFDEKAELQILQQPHQRQFMSKQKIMNYFANIKNQEAITQRRQPNMFDKQNILQSEPEKQKIFFNQLTNFKSLLQKFYIDFTTLDLRDLSIKQKNEKPTQKEYSLTNQIPTKENFEYEAFKQQIILYHPVISQIEGEHGSIIREQFHLLLYMCHQRQDRRTIRGQIITLKQQVEKFIQESKSFQTKKRSKQDLYFQDLQNQNYNLQQEFIPIKKRKK